MTLIASKWIWGTDGKLCFDDRSEYINDDGVKMIRLPMKGKENFQNKLKKYVNVYDTIAKEKPDILFVHGLSYVDIGTVARYLKKHPQVVAYADNHADLTNSGTNWLSLHILQKGIWKYYAHKINPYIKKFYGVLPVRVDFLTDIYGLPKEKCELLVMGADDELVAAASTDEVKNKIRKQYKISPDDFLVMTGGKIDQWKTQTLLLMEAVRNIKSEKVKLIVFGSVAPELKEKVETLADGKKVQYIGWIQARDSYQYFAAADLVVFPGRHSVFWEQVAAQGIPMLCKDLPGTHHVDVGGNVRFLNEDSEKEIRKEINELY